MNIEKRHLIVLVLTDLTKWGFDNETLKPLLDLVISSRPTLWERAHTGVTGYYIFEKISLPKVEKFIEETFNLKEEKEVYKNLSIGLADGEMTVRIDFWKHYSKKRRPEGAAYNKAFANAQVENGYNEVLADICLRMEPREEEKISDLKPVETAVG